MKDFLGKRIYFRDKAIYYSAKKKKYYNVEVAGFNERSVRVILEGERGYINVSPLKLVVTSRDR